MVSWLFWKFILKKSFKKLKKAFSALKISIKRLNFPPLVFALKKFMIGTKWKMKPFHKTAIIFIPPTVWHDKTSKRPILYQCTHKSCINSVFPYTMPYRFLVSFSNSILNASTSSPEYIRGTIWSFFLWCCDCCCCCWCTESRCLFERCLRRHSLLPLDDSCTLQSLFFRSSDILTVRDAEIKKLSFQIYIFYVRLQSRDFRKKTFYIAFEEILSKKNCSIKQMQKYFVALVSRVCCHGSMLMRHAVIMWRK